MSSIPFWKVQSIGNDFVLVQEGSVPHTGLPQLAIQTSQRRFSVGSDGLLVVGRSVKGLKLQMFNPDGSEDFCGNGLRCAAHFAKTQGWIDSETIITHLGRDVPAQVLPDGSVLTYLEPASFAPEDVPHLFGGELVDQEIQLLSDKVRITALSTGSTHTIVFEGTIPSDDRLQRIGRELEHHPLFPERTSVIWVVVDRPGELSIRIWERGAGETLGCGTGSSAAAIAYARREGFVGAVNVHNPGGTVSVEVQDWCAPVMVSGTATISFRGQLKVQA